MLRLMGIVILVGAAVSVLSTLLGVAMGSAYSDAAAVAGAGAIVSLVVSLAITALVLWWLTFTITAWNNRDPRGSTHALIIAILATVFGVLGVLGGLLGGLFVGAAIFVAGVSPLYMVVGLLQLLVSAGYAYCGIMILMNRTKATAGTGNAAGTTN